MKIVECNARIKSADLFIEDHGIWTSFIHVEANGWGCGFGGYDLRGRYMFEWVSQVCKALGVTRWGDIPGLHVRVRRESNQLVAIGHIVEDRWLNYSEYIEALEAKEGDSNVG